MSYIHIDVYMWIHRDQSHVSGIHSPKFADPGCPDMSSSRTGVFGMKLGTWQKRSSMGWSSKYSRYMSKKGGDLKFFIESLNRWIFQMERHIHRNAAFSQDPNWSNVGGWSYHRLTIFSSTHEPQHQRRTMGTCIDAAFGGRWIFCVRVCSGSSEVSSGELFFPCVITLW